MDPLVLLIFGVIGFIIGFLCSFFRKLHWAFAIPIFYVLSTFVFLIDPVIRGDSNFSNILTFHAFGTAFLYCIFGNTLAGLPMFIASRWLFLKLNLFK